MWMDNSESSVTIHSCEDVNDGGANDGTSAPPVSPCGGAAIAAAAVVVVVVAAAAAAAAQLWWKL
jgi:hypothetical protein